MKISIALCTYNAEKYLADQLQSFCDQTRLPDELVICDDRSGDSTREMLAQFIKTAPFLVRLYLNEENLGMVKNFDKVISLCEGDIIFPSDADDVWDASKLHISEEYFKADEELGLLFSDASIVETDLSDTGVTLWQAVNFNETRRREVETGHAFDQLLRDGYFFGACFAFRNKFQNLISPIPENIYFIHDCWIALAVASVAPVKLINRPLLKYRQHSNQLSGGLKDRMPSPVKAVIGSVQRKNQYDGVLEQLRVLQERLEATGRGSDIVRQKLAAAIRHNENRTALPKSFFGRLTKVVPEFLQGNYHFYSNGFKSAVKDIFLAR